MEYKDISANQTSYMRGDLQIKANKNSVQLICGSISSAVPASVWTTIATITETKYHPSGGLSGVLINGSLIGQYIINTSGEIRAFVTKAGVYHLVGRSYPI